MRIFTIGYEGATEGELIAALQKAGVKRVIDVARCRCRAARFFQERPRAALEEAGIEYVHLKALGTPAEGAPRRGRGGMPTWSEFMPVSSSCPKRWRNRRKCLSLRARSPAHCCAWSASRRIAIARCC